MVADGDHDEAIKRAHPEYIAATTVEFDQVEDSHFVLVDFRYTNVGAWTVARPTFPKLTSLRPAVAKGNTVLDEALALLHLQALRGLQSCIDILAAVTRLLLSTQAS
jgi:hypothetical protein